MALGQEHHVLCCPRPSLISLCLDSSLASVSAPKGEKNDWWELRWCLSRSGSEQRVANAAGLFWQQTWWLDGTSEFSLVTLLGVAYNNHERLWWKMKTLKYAYGLLHVWSGSIQTDNKDDVGYDNALSCFPWWNLQQRFALKLNSQRNIYHPSCIN